MTTEIIHAPSGSYKTASLLSLYLRQAVKDNRVVVTNIRGLDNVNLIKKTFGYKKSTFSIVNVGFGKDGFDKLARFFHWVPEGAMILMDEGQRVYPTRLRSLSEFDYNGELKDFQQLSVNESGEDWPRTVEYAFDSHRHHNWDIYITTTNIAKVHKEIRQMSEFGYRHKNLKGMTSLPFLSGRYKRVKHDAENNGKTQASTLSSSIEKIDEKVFKLYESTRTGSTNDIKSSTSLFSNVRFLLAFMCILIGFGSVLSNYFTTGHVILSDTPTANDSQESISQVKPESVIDPVQKAHGHAHQKGADISSGNDDHRDSHKDDHVIDLFNNIQYFHTSIVRKVANTYYSTLIFQTDVGHITSVSLTSLGIMFKPFNGYYLLSYGDLNRFIPIGDPHPDYFHFDDQRQSSSDNQPQPTLSENPLQNTLF